MNDFFEHTVCFSTSLRTILSEHLFSLFTDITISNAALSVLARIHYNKCVEKLISAYDCVIKNKKQKPILIALLGTLHSAAAVYENRRLQLPARENPLFLHVI